MTTATETLTVPLNKLEPWSGNVRRHEPKAGVKELAASIEAHGLLQSLVVQKNGNGMYKVIAGRRRFLALQSLQKSGSIKATYPVPCSVMDPEANPSELSLAENFQREPMHPADEFEAFAKLHKGGMTAAEIAERNGVSEVQVEKRLKLANVAPSLIKLYREGGLTLNHVMAFATTTDHEAQEKVWRDMPTYNRRDPEAVRRMLNEGEINAKDRRVRFVGLAAYEKAEGTIRRDLFAKDEDGAFIVDKELLETLVAAKLEKVKASVSKEGWKWVEMRVEREFSEWSNCSRRYEEASPLPPKKQAELDKLNAELEVLLESDDGEDENPAADKLQAKIDKITEGQERVWQPDTLNIAGAVVSIGNNGKVEIERGLVKPEDKPRATKTVKRENGEAEVEDNYPLSAALVESLTTQRTAAIRAVLKDNPEVALKAVVHALASQHFYNSTSDESPLKIRVIQPQLKDIETSLAHEALEQAEAKWKGKLPGKENDLWSWCIKQKQETLLSLLAFCVAHSVDAIATHPRQLDSERIKQTDAIVKALGLSMSDWFKASAENFFGRVSKPVILEALKEAKVEITPAMEKAKKGELASIAERELGKSKWLPEMLREPTP